MARSRPVWLLYASVQLLGAALFFVVPAGPWRPALLVLLDALTVVALLVGIRRRRPPAATGWYLLAVGQALNAGAWVCWYLYPVAASVTVPVPSIGDFLFLGSYGVSSLGLAWLAYGQGARRGVLLDTGILATSVGVVSWVVFLDGAADAGLAPAALAVNIGFVAGDVLLLAFAAAFAFVAGRSPRSLLLVGWAVLQLSGDLIFNLQVLDGSFRLGSGTFAWWLASFALLSAAALHPVSPAPQRETSRSWRYAILFIAVAPLPLLLVLRAVQSSTTSVAVIAGGSLLVTALVLARFTAAEHNGAITAAARAGLRRAVLRLCVGVVVFALLPLAGLVYLSVQEARSTVASEVRRRLAASVDASVANVDAQLAGLRTLVASYAERPSLVRTMSTGKAVDLVFLQESLASLQARNPAFVGAWAMDAGGTLVAFDPPQPSLVGKNFAYRDYFQGGVRTRLPYVSDAFAGAIPGQPLVVAVGVPVIAGDRIVGLIGLGYRVDALGGLIDQLADVQGVRLKLADRRGTLLAGRGDQGAGLVSAKSDKHVRAALGGGSGSAHEVEQGVDLLTAYRPIPALGWAVVAEIPASEAFAGVYGFTGRVLAVGSLLAQAMLAGLLLAVRTERRRRVAEVELAQREEHVTEILQAAGDAFISIDANGRVARWNTQAEATFGWPTGEALGQPLVDLVVPEDQHEAHLRGVARVTSGGPAHLLGQRVEVQARRRDGGLFPAELLVWGSTTEKATYSAFVRDITDRKRAEAQAETARDDALAASRLKSEFVANMSHEIRTPMNGVIGLTGLLLDTDLDSRQRDYLTTVESSAEALLGVINDILDFSKIEAGKLDIDPVDFDVRVLVEDVVSLLAANAQAKDLEIAAVVIPAIPPAVHGDVHRIRQILTNLVSNAVKFTRDGEVVVTAEVGAVDSEQHHHVTFTVSDTGIGIPADSQDQLFEAFTQVDTSTTRQYGGTGLGLTISRQLVELMGGTIGVDSRPDEGSRFHFSLVLPVASAAFPPPSRPLADLAGVRALVVDDSATNRTIIDDLLTTWGMRPVVVADADQAVTALRVAVAAGDPFGIALLDMHMPDVDGLALARAITADAAIGGVRLAMLTSTDSETRAARADGIEVYLTKPVRAGQLHAALRQLLGDAKLPAGLAAEPVRRSAPAPHTITGTRILIAEDNEVNQQVAVEILASLGYTADVAGDGAQALQLLQVRHYDAVLMDCQMPVLDGLQATERIRRLPAPLNAVPIIALTASALASDEQRCRAAGMDDFLTKPMRRQQLADALRGVLRGELGPAGAARVDNPPSSDLLEPATLQELRDMGPGFTRRVLPGFLRNAPAAAAAITAAAARQDMVEVARLAHKFKGSSATLAGRRLAATCTELEQAARRGDLAAATALTVTVEQQTEATCAALRTALTPPTAP